MYREWPKGGDPPSNFESWFCFIFIMSFLFGPLIFGIIAIHMGW